MKTFRPWDCHYLATIVDEFGHNAYMCIIWITLSKYIEIYSSNMFEKHQKVRWYKIFCVYKRKIRTEKPKKRLTSTNEMNQKLKKSADPVCSKGKRVRGVPAARGNNLLQTAKTHSEMCWYFLRRKGLMRFTLNLLFMQDSTESDTLVTFRFVRVILVRE